MRTKKQSINSNMSLLVALFGVLVLTHLCETFSLQTRDVGERNTEASSVPKPMVSLKSIERRATADGKNNFTVRFEKDILNVMVFVNNWALPLADPVSLFEESSGVWVASFVSKTSNPFVWLEFGNRDVYDAMYVELNNSGSDPQFQNFIYYPYLEVSSGNVAVYNAGEDIEMSIGNHDMAKGRKADNQQDRETVVCNREDRSSTEGLRIKCNGGFKLCVRGEGERGYIPQWKDAALSKV
ncbi:hypothetical protein PoB_004621100 [Plakobranchus ocellatus]|uniref:Uncharacterized protein n=1 Tax=Plakobranchus ocellatus TaxID=259542 RepID=A0AAV4B8K7_9GAST|nr:hypothetical protein PoB_004621100 [Plakobranchus ocellatus]